MELFNGKTLEEVKKEIEEIHNEQAKETFKKLEQEQEEKNRKNKAIMENIESLAENGKNEKIEDQEILLKRQHEKEIEKLKNIDALDESYKLILRALENRENRVKEPIKSTENEKTSLEKAYLDFAKQIIK